jgi:hypothetical protein
LGASNLVYQFLRAGFPEEARELAKSFNFEDDEGLITRAVAATFSNTEMEGTKIKDLLENVQNHRKGLSQLAALAVLNSPTKIDGRWSLPSSGIDVELRRTDADTISGRGETRKPRGLLASLTGETEPRQFKAARIALQLWEYRIYTDESIETERGLLAFESDGMSALLVEYASNGSASTSSMRKVNERADLHESHRL